MGGSLQTAADEFLLLFKRHLNGNTRAAIRWVMCSDVDWDQKTMNCVGSADELEYYDVSLGFGSVDTKPVVGSDCMIAILEGNESVAFMIYANRVELIEFNGGRNGGMAITPELVSQLNKTNELLQSVLSVILGAPVPEPGSGNPSALQAALKTAVYGKELGNYSKVENLSITH